MRLLVLMRGLPASGKSTWIRDNGLGPWAVSSDSIRMLRMGVAMSVDGAMGVPQARPQAVFDELWEAVSNRLSRGITTFVDATNVRARDMNRALAVADAARARVWCCDFTGVPVSECLARNAARPEPARVPDAVVEGMAARLAGERVPKRIRVLSPDGCLARLSRWPAEVDLDAAGYSSALFVGDVHGCPDALAELVGDMPRGRLHVFCGDWCDRGPDSAATAAFMAGAAAMPNVVLVEGNHERHLRAWAGGAEARPGSVFWDSTVPQLEAAGASKADVAAALRRMVPAVLVRSSSFEALACHGGIPRMHGMPMLLGEDDLVRGPGSYGDVADVEEAWERLGAPAYMVHGHRAPFPGGEPANPTPHAFNLEGAVERGGAMRAVEMFADGRPPVVREAAQPGFAGWAGPRG